MFHYANHPRVLGPLDERTREILTPEAIDFVAGLHRNFESRRRALLVAREALRSRSDAGELPDFLPGTAYVRESDWTVGSLPAELLDRRVEITGPVDRRTMIEALNSGARVFTADLDEAARSSWEKIIEGQLNLRDCWAGTLDFGDPAAGKNSLSSNSPAVLMVRPRDWHLVERHLEVDCSPVSASLFDFGLYVFHNAHAAARQGSGSYFHLPNVESHLEARLWREVFAWAEERLGLPVGSLKATVMIDSLSAAFQMEEILYELRLHAVGLACSRRDGSFSAVGRLSRPARGETPDFADAEADVTLLDVCSLQLIKTCHRRGVLAIGGAADTAIEAEEGFDGTCVGHPELVPGAIEIFDRLMPGPNQLWRKRQDVVFGRAEMLCVPDGEWIADVVANGPSDSVERFAAE